MHALYYVKQTLKVILKIALNIDFVLDMVEILLQAGEKIHKSKRDQHGWTPLHFAAHLGNIEIMKKLLGKDNSAAYKADKKGKTALHVAAGRGKVDIM
ncbi:hypothetical protein LWI29_017416 [Acer saccharum]|uniref:Uncharacterized protein n=1 Tax=Acer saccharum TaxID=4024 RepID=A0AA39TCD8_ACESA|nr:hypothetical protein LWI29_017416 [Acer saccharum]